MAQGRKGLTDRRVAAETDGGSREAEKRRAAALRKQRETQLRQAQREEAQAKLAAEQEKRRAAAARQKAQLEQERKARQAQQQAQKKDAASAASVRQKRPAAGTSARTQQRQTQGAPASAQTRQASRSAPGQPPRLAAEPAQQRQRPQQTQRKTNAIRQEPFLRVEDVSRQSRGRRPRRRYPPNSPAAIKRQKRLQRRLIMICVALVVIALAILFSTDVLFKVVNIRIETMERTVPANTGIYKESEIIAASEIEEGAALFSISPKKVREQLLVSLPYLENVQVRFSLPTTVEIQVEPATENLYVRSGSNYAVLSRTFRVLKLDSERPEGLVELRARVDGTPQVGYSLAFTQVDEKKDEEATAQAKEENQSLAETLEMLVGYLQEEGIYAPVTQINLRDMTDITLTFWDRVTAEIGTVNNIDYKCRMLGTLIRNDDGSGISENDRGTLDVSRCYNTGKAYFTPD